MLRGLPLWLMLSGLLSWIQPLNAQPSGVLPGAPPIGLEAVLAVVPSGSAAQHLEYLLQFERIYSGVPEFDYPLGVAALKAEQYGLALHALERVVFIRPGHAGAWIDLALAHLHLGEYTTANALLEHVEQNFQPPAALALQVKNIREQLSRATRQEVSNGVLHWQGEVALLRSHTTNANVGLTVGGLTLTPGGDRPVYVEIAPSQRAQADMANQWRGVLQAGVDHGNERRTFFALMLDKKQYDTFSTFNTQDLGVAVSHSLPVPGWGQQGLQMSLGGSLHNVQLGQHTLLNMSNVQLGVHYPYTPACTLSARVEGEVRNYVKYGYYDATIAWLGGALYCGTPRGAVTVMLRQGAERAEGNRPGGNSTRQELVVDYQLPLSGQTSLEGYLNLARIADDQGYSPLLENNARRNTQRRSWRLSLNWGAVAAGAKGWLLQGMVEENREDANIALFRLSERVYSLGLRYRF